MLRYCEVGSTRQGFWIIQPSSGGKTFRSYFGRSRKLAFPRSTKDRRLNTKRLPIAARPRPRTSRFNAERVSIQALSVQAGGGASRRSKTKVHSAGVGTHSCTFLAPSNRRRTLPVRCSIFLDPFFQRHERPVLQIAARPHVDDPFDPGCRPPARGVVRRLQYQRLPR